ncbi:MAG: hypothetical protein ACE5KY_00650 [Candidatus Tectimicrobiota bacterium]
MKKTIALAAVALLVVGLATTAFAHGPRFAGAYSPGYGHMRGMGHMMGAHMGWTAEGQPCVTGETQAPWCQWATEGRTVTPEEEKAFKERSKTYVERYLERFLPEYTLTPKTETPKEQ